MEGHDGDGPGSTPKAARRCPQQRRQSSTSLLLPRELRTVWAVRRHWRIVGGQALVISGTLCALLTSLSTHRPFPLPCPARACSLTAVSPPSCSSPVYLFPLSRLAPRVVRFHVPEFAHNSLSGFAVQPFASGCWRGAPCQARTRGGSAGRACWDGERDVDAASPAAVIPRPLELYFVELGSLESTSSTLRLNCLVWRGVGR